MSVAFSAPTLETERLILRGPQVEDAQAFIDFYGSERSHMAGGPRDPREAWTNLAADFGHWVMRGFGMFSVALKGNEQTIGIVGHYYPHTRPEREIGWVLFDPSLEGKGLAFEAAKACIAHAFGPLGWDTAVSYIDARNTRSIRLAERLGATLDPDAQKPASANPTLVYRHPRPA